MSEFYKRFLMEESRRLSPDAGRYVALAAFGKHPGWDDHVEDLGLETDSLNLAKQVLYVQGVGGQIDTGAWEKLKDEQRLGTFNHTFVWQRGDQFLLGRMWSSSDGKGRTRYPMILCAHFAGVPLAWAVQFALPRIEDAEKACRETKSAEDVRTILTRARAALRNSINDPGVANGDKAPSPSALNQFVSAPAFGENREGWFRVLYWLHSQEKSFGAGKFNPKGDLTSLRPQQFRVPPGLAGTTPAVPLWSRFLAMHMDRQVPALFVWPAEREWLDITLGEPASHEFFCLRAEREALPLATEIPYDFDQVFRASAAQELAAFQSGSTQRPVSVAVKAATGAGAAGDQPGFFKSLAGKFLMGGGLLAVLVAVAVVFLRGGGDLDGKGTEVKTTPAWEEPAPPKPLVQDEELQKQQEVEAEKARRAAEAKAKTDPAEAARLKAEAEAKEQEKVRLAAEARRREELDRQRAEAEAKAKAEAVKADAAKAAAAEAARLKAEAEAKEKARLAQLATSVPPPAVVAPTSAPVVVKTSVPVAVKPPVAAGVREKVITNGVGMVLLWVPGLPGSGDGGWVGKFEVKQSEYQKLAGVNPSKFVDGEQPVEYVSWTEAADFCRKLTEAETAAGRLPPGYAYGLPTRQQWDYFLGNVTFESGGFENAITSRNQPNLRAAPARVGSLPPNQFGLCDVLGNVWEWCADSDAPEQKMLKGAAYNNVKTYQFKPLERTTVRRLAPDSKSPDAGFRCVVAPAP